MRDFFGVDRKEVGLFAASAGLYIVIVFAWILLVADRVFELFPFIPSLPVLGGLPDQSISKLVIATLLYLVATVYALLSLATSEHRRYLPLFAGLGALTFAAWTTLNAWVIAGFLNAAPGYIVVSVVLMGAWFGGLMRFISKYPDPMALFMVRLGLGLSLFITLVQVIALLTPEWRSPTQGIPVLYNLTFNAMIGLILAGVGANLLWREKRAEFLAAASRRR